MGRRFGLDSRLLELEGGRKLDNMLLLRFDFTVVVSSSLELAVCEVAAAERKDWALLLRLKNVSMGILLFVGAAGAG